MKKHILIFALSLLVFVFGASLVIATEEPIKQVSSLPESIEKITSPLLPELPEPIPCTVDDCWLFNNQEQIMGGIDAMQSNLEFCNRQRLQALDTLQEMYEAASAELAALSSTDLDPTIRSCFLLPEISSTASSTIGMMDTIYKTKYNNLIDGLERFCEKPNNALDHFSDVIKDVQCSIGDGGVIETQRAGFQATLDRARDSAQAMLENAQRSYDSLTLQLNNFETYFPTAAGSAEACQDDSILRLDDSHDLLISTDLSPTLLAHLSTSFWTGNLAEINNGATDNTLIAACPVGEDKLTSIVFFDSKGNALYSSEYAEGKVTSISVFKYRHDDPATDVDEPVVIESVQHEVKGDAEKSISAEILESADINRDGVMVNSKDVSALQSLALASQQVTPEDITLADINKDGLIDEKDAELFELALKSVRDINGDGVIDERDTQLITDICSDTDNDTVIDGIDNCPLTQNPDQADLDTDGLGDVCDNCPNDPDNDVDNDGMCGDVDSCPLENPQGMDADSDGCTDTIEGLFDNLQNTEIRAGVKKSLSAKLDSTASSHGIPATNKLGAFINQVEAQSGKKISQKDANLLVSFAQNIIQVNTVQLACIQPPSGIIGWWSGDNTPNDLINGNNAVLHDDASFANGKVGNAFNLDGIGDYASIPYSSALEPNEITVEFWVSGPQMNQQPGNTGGIGVALIENSIANHEGWSIFVTDPSAYTGGIGVIIGNGTQWNPIISTVGLWYPASGWRHVAMTYDGTYMQLYLNGVPQFGSGSGKPVSNAQLSTGRAINIGASWNNGSFARFFKGLIDEVEIYDRALSISEIQSIYNAGSAGKCKPNVCVAAPSELVGWWTMDDATGSSIADDRAGSNNGIVNGATLGVAGKVATAADFDGVGEYIEVPDNADLNPTDAITIDTWIKLDSLPNPNYGFIIDKVYFDPSVIFFGYSLDVLYDGRIRFAYHGINGLTQGAMSTNGLSTGTWHHVAATMDSNADIMRVYIDGQLDKQVSQTLVPINPSPTPLFIGSSNGGFQVIDGKIDELEIFDRALTPFEIWSIYNAGTAGKCKTLTPVPVPNDPVE